MFGLKRTMIKKNKRKNLAAIVEIPEFRANNYTMDEKKGIPDFIEIR